MMLEVGGPMGSLVAAELYLFVSISEAHKLSNGIKPQARPSINASLRIWSSSHLCDRSRRPLHSFL